jgi:hypothetical protein
VTDRISRRRFIAAGAISSTVLPLSSALSAQPLASLSVDDSLVTNRDVGAATPSAVSPVRAAALANPAKGSWTRWLDDRVPAVFAGATWGTPWPRGVHPATTRFALRDQSGGDYPLQSWPLALWPDGSLKWTAHALAADTALTAGPFEVVAGRAAKAPTQLIKLNESEQFIEVDTGAITCRLPRQGAEIISSMARNGRETLRAGILVLQRRNHPDASAAMVQFENFVSSITKVTIEQRGPIRVVVKIEGMHSGSAARSWLPFTVRLYFYAGSDTLRMMHTLVFDGEEASDYISGIGLRFDVPLADALHDRHVRFASSNGGVFAEAVRGLTGLRRDPGKAVRDAQLAGTTVADIAPAVKTRLELIPAFGDWTLLQPNANSFSIRKRTTVGHSWLDSDRGCRAAGMGFVGGPSGGVAFGIRNFWQSHPAQLDIRDAHTQAAQVTLWLWAPDAPPMDLRFYHDGMGQDTYEKQNEGLEITYEDYEPGFGTAMGVARTSEMSLTVLAETPGHERFVQLAEALSAPPVLVPTPQTLRDSGVFAHSFTLPDHSAAFNAEIERRLAWLVDFYRQQQDERSWYGFWNYGDVMHSYDADRHTWRYDVGGFAWDNSELSTDIWLWLQFLRTGNADLFRFAEAMTRHTGEVDVHHLGRFAPLGSRHNVMHWGCSAKQLRISTALNRRYYYYLTADERVGDLMREQLEAARTLRTIQPNRKVGRNLQRPAVDADGDYAYLGFGTDWGSIAGAWLTEWERTGDHKFRDRLLASMHSIGRQPKGFFTGSSRMNLQTGAFDISSDQQASASHLTAAFGLPEVCAELLELFSVPEFERAWLQYCELFNASPQEQQQALGNSLGTLNLQQGHARLTAFAAYRRNDARLAARAWAEFEAGRAGFPASLPFQTRRIDVPAVLNPVDEAAWLSTNAASQWALAAIECLAFAKRA